MKYKRIGGVILCVVMISTPVFAQSSALSVFVQTPSDISYSKQIAQTEEGDISSVQTSENSEENPCVKAEKDAKSSTNGNLWFWTSCIGSGLFSPIAGVGLIATALLVEPPSSFRDSLKDKSSDYALTYSKCYRNEVKYIRTSRAAMGCIGGSIIYSAVVIYLLFPYIMMTD